MVAADEVGTTGTDTPPNPLALLQAVLDAACPTPRPVLPNLACDGGPDTILGTIRCLVTELQQPMPDIKKCMLEDSIFTLAFHHEGLTLPPDLSLGLKDLKVPGDSSEFAISSNDLSGGRLGNPTPGQGYFTGCLDVTGGNCQ